MKLRAIILFLVTDAAVMIDIFYFVGDAMRVDQPPNVGAAIKAISTQVHLYQHANGAYPTTEQGIAALVERPKAEPLPRRWQKLMLEVPSDPWGTAYAYELPARRSTEPFDIYSCGPDRRANTPDDIGNW